MPSSFEYTPQFTYSLSSITDLFNQHPEFTNLLPSSTHEIISSSPLLVKQQRQSSNGLLSSAKNHDSSNHSIFPCIHGLSELLKEDLHNPHSNLLHDDINNPQENPKQQPFENLTPRAILPSTSPSNHVSASHSNSCQTKTPSPSDGSQSKDVVQHHNSTTIDCGVVVENGDDLVKSLPSSIRSLISNQQNVMAPQQPSALDFVTAYAMFLQNQQKQQTSPSSSNLNVDSSRKIPLATNEYSTHRLNTGILDVLSGSSMNNPNAFILMQKHNQQQTFERTQPPQQYTTFRSSSPSSSSIPTPNTSNSIDPSNFEPSSNTQKRKRNADKDHSSKKQKKNSSSLISSKKEEKLKQERSSMNAISSTNNSASFLHQQQYAIACGNIWFVPNEFDVFRSGKKRQGIQYKFENMITPSNYKGASSDRRE